MIRRWLDRRRRRRQLRAISDRLDREQLERLNQLLSGNAPEPLLEPTHRLIDGPVNRDTPYFDTMRGQQVHVHQIAADGCACGLIIGSGLPFDGWHVSRLEPIEADGPSNF